MLAKYPWHPLAIIFHAFNADTNLEPLVSLVRSKGPLALLAPHATDCLHFYSGIKGSGSGCWRCSSSHSGLPYHKGSRRSSPIYTLPGASSHIVRTLDSRYYYPHSLDCSSFEGSSSVAPD
ncbi:hypothetical protein TIFTF001_046568 [Ficus carica]|uniref:Uncharacterized protein n=1 Tax=Ficus carica TaxID=3494 RepID=A0AA88DAM8_FICCA|nr:hypothetical protein TIFTF001_046568 [Ficus carica]